MAQIDLIGPDNHNKPPATREETRENGWSFKRIVDSINSMMTEVYGALDALTSAGTSAPGALDEFTVATVPAAADNARKLIYVSDGAAGEPIVAFSDGTDWLRCDTKAAISGAA